MRFYALCKKCRLEIESDTLDGMPSRCVRCKRELIIYDKELRVTKTKRELQKL